VKRAYLMVLCAFLAAGATAFAWACWKGIHSPYELDYGEGIILWQTAHVTHLAEAYKTLDRYPYIVFHYPPVYHLASVFVGLFTGDLLQAGRLVSFVSAAMLCAVAAWFVWVTIPRRLGRQLRWGAALAGGLLCANLPAMAWAQFMRVDMLGLLLTFLGLLLFVSGRRGLEYGAFLCFVLAVFTKQTLIAAPAACLAVAVAADWRRASRLVAFALVLGCAGLLALAVPTHGAALANLFLYNRNPFSIVNMLGLLQLNLAGIVPVAGVAFAVPIWLGSRLTRVHRRGALEEFARWTRGSIPRRCAVVATLHLLIALLVSLSCGKKGSNVNYFLEWNITACILASVVLAAVLWRWDAVTPEISRSAVLLVLLLFASSGVFALANRLRPEPPSGRAAEFARAIELVRHVRGPVYSENMTLLLKAGKDIPAEPAIITVLAMQGAWDQNEFVGRIRNARFGAIVVTTSLENPNRFTPQVKVAIEKAYRPTCREGEFQIYLPKGSSDEVCGSAR
jgi:hypothetical protein